MTAQGSGDFRKLPTSPTVEETIAFQLEGEEPYGGPGGGGNAADGDGD